MVRAAVLALAALAMPVGLAAQDGAGEDVAKLDLAREIAARGMLATIGPMQTQAEIAAIIAEHPELTAEQQDRLRSVGFAEAEALGAKAVEAEAQALAATLTLDDLTAIAAFERSDAAANRRAALPTVMATVMASLGNADYKGAVKAAYCKETGLLCQP